MTWEFSAHEYEVFNRNPLRETNVEVKFHPILSITDNREKLSTFQDLVRGQFPIFEESNVKNVGIDASIGGGVHVYDQKVYSFTKSDQSQKITLSNSSILINTRQHLDRDQITASLKYLIEHFNNVFGMFSPLRLGVRYINVINLRLIADNLSEGVAWEDLINSGFLNYPQQLVNRKSLLSKTDLRTDIAGGIGELNLQYGMNSVNPASEPNEYIFDVDRYVNNPEVTDIVSLTHCFTEDIYSLFLDMAGEKLISWMKS